MATSLIRFEAARQALAEARSIDEVKDVRDKAEALRLYVKQQGESLEMQNDIAEIKLRAERRAGELLAEMDRARPGDNNITLSSPPIGLPRPTLADIGVSKNQSSNWQRIAAMPEETFEQVIAETKHNGDELTSAGMLRAAKGQTMQVHYSSAESRWNTPPEIINRVLQVLDTIDLDPCSDDADNPNIPAIQVFTIADDGLAQHWNGRVYMNPPYGDTIGEWVNKLVSSYQNGMIEAIALLPARTDTRWFRQLKPFARCFVWGRLHFSNSDNSAPFPSMVVYLGSNVQRFAEAFEDTGDIYVSFG